jgi:hypothetical protein
MKKLIDFRGYLRRGVLRCLGKNCNAPQAILARIRGYREGVLAIFFLGEKKVGADYVGETGIRVFFPGHNGIFGHILQIIIDNKNNVLTMRTSSIKK